LRLEPALPFFFEAYFLEAFFFVFFKYFLTAITISLFDGKLPHAFYLMPAQKAINGA
jgi:hypothetical protein